MNISDYNERKSMSKIKGSTAGQAENQNQAAVLLTKGVNLGEGSATVMVNRKETKLNQSDF